MPDAVPAWRCGTALITDVVSGATVIVIPTPRTTIGATSVRKEPAMSAMASSAKPQAAMTGPMTSGRRAPKRSISPPDQRDSTAMIAVKGRNALPASVAENPCTWMTERQKEERPAERRINAV